MIKTYNKYIIYLVVFSVFLLRTQPFAYEYVQGCCSGYGGVAYKGIDPLCRNNRVVCKNGSLSPTCSCKNNNDFDNLFYEIQIKDRDIVRQTHQTINKGGTLNDWEIIKIVSDNNEIAIKTEKSNANYLEHFSRNNKYAGGTIIGPTNINYSVKYVLRASIWNIINEKDNKIELQYKFNDTYNYENAYIYKFTFFNNYAIIFFQPQNVTKYEADCKRNKYLTFKIITSNGEDTFTFSLDGFSRANSLAYSMLKY